MLPPQAQRQILRSERLNRKTIGIPLPECQDSLGSVTERTRARVGAIFSEREERGTAAGGSTPQCAPQLSPERDLESSECAHGAQRQRSGARRLRRVPCNVLLGVFSRSACPVIMSHCPSPNESTSFGETTCAYPEEI